MNLTENEIKVLESENKKLREALTMIHKIVNDNKESTRSLSVYDGAQIYAECCEALGLDK